MSYQALYTEFLAKSRYNDIPDSPAARATLRALIDQTRSDLRNCSESITRRQISRVLELQESLLAPIRTLFPEILIEIFRLVIETSTNPGITYISRLRWHVPISAFVPKLSGCIFLFTWTCFWWRHEAISYSPFWSRIRVQHRSDPLPTRSAEVAAFLNECILRSGVSAPMSIDIYSVTDGSPPAVSTMLAAQAYRWRQAVLLFTSLHSLVIMFPSKPSSTRFPLLEDLSCRFYYTDSRILPVPNPILECRPPLQKLELHELMESYADIIASRNLKFLKVGCYSGVSFAKLLLMCPCLESLQVGSFVFREDPDANQAICQSSLLSFAIGPDFSDDYPTFDNGSWKCVTLPKLTKLEVNHLDLYYKIWTALLSELKEVVKRSQCTLRHVNLFKHGRWPVLETAENFLQDLLVNPEECFVDEVPWQEWKANNAVVAYESDSDDSEW
ncbi:hypothetical protein BDP27DRAFT_1326659 [Rhodocollybia butyracea]|uniref:Uncharacterized protein n=1 Tax=Rhodocollybia butyracea TaxID=206335 RepID=A0A9P5PSW3_9AGAR|nr:hypothetical protein BDP27DRAFT_1326659 [Rhodocollybia butyracea]